MIAALRDLPRRVPLSPPSLPVRLRPHPHLDAPRLHEAAFSRAGRLAARGCPGPRLLDRRHRRLSRRDGHRVRRRRWRCSTRVGFDALFAFTYSPRPGTSALARRTTCPQDEKKRRLQVLNARQQESQRRANEARVGRVEEVLIESVDGPGRVSGRTPHFRIVHLDAAVERIGQSVERGDHGRRAQRGAGTPFATPSLTGSSGAPIFAYQEGDVVEIEMAIKGLMVDPITNMPIIVLREVDGQRVLPIWVGRLRGQRDRPAGRKGADAPPDDARPASHRHRRAGRAGRTHRGLRVEGEHVLRPSPRPLPAGPAHDRRSAFRRHRPRACGRAHGSSSRSR